MKPYLREFPVLKILSDYPDGTYYEAGFLTSKNADWRSQKPVIDTTKCNHCLQCYLHCPDGVISKTAAVLSIDYDFCKGCGICEKICRRNAIKMEGENP